MDGLVYKRQYKKMEGFFYQPGPSPGFLSAWAYQAEPKAPTLLDHRKNYFTGISSYIEKT
jgi:hypothetical protein